MIIKGMDFVFYCAQCRGIVREDVSEKPLDGKFYCNCAVGLSAGKNELKFNGVRFNKE